MPVSSSEETPSVWTSAEARYRHQRHHHYSDNSDGLIIISEQDVDLSLDRFTIDVRQAKGAYKGIRVKNALGKLLDLQRVQVVYSDGSVHNEDRQIDMYSGERSRPINETPDSRFVDQINITQEPGPGRGRLQVIGIQDDEGRRMDRSGRGGGAYSSSLTTSSTQQASRYPESGVSSDVPVKPTVPEPTQTAPGQATAGGDVDRKSVV